jgi:hypothetical protein
VADPSDLSPIRLDAYIEVLLERAAGEIRSAVAGPVGESTFAMLRALARIRPAVDDTTDNLVRLMRSWDVSWGEIAAMLGCDERAARDSYGFVEGQAMRASYVDPRPNLADGHS